MAQTPTIKPTPPQTKPAALRTFHEALMLWYKTHGRHDLPWRNTTDAYEIWVSEVMLQQTQVATVRDRFYPPFLKKFSTVEDLADAPRESVMKMWEGLGYYSRAVNLHKAAEKLTQNARSARQNISSLPNDVDALLALPGIGRNTANAILAFAYHQPVAILEANVKRVVARIFTLTHPTDAELWDSANALLDTSHPFDYNQAMMDLGSMVCTPKTPNCAACPAAKICNGKKSPEKYPAPKQKKIAPIRKVTIDVHEDAAGKLYLEQRTDRLLGGLWGFPQTSHTSKKVIGKITHIYSHFRLEGSVTHTIVQQNMAAEGWVTRAQIKKLPLSKLDHKVLALVEKHHSTAKKPSKAKAARLKR